jgi:hypothetical protein
MYQQLLDLRVIDKPFDHRICPGICTARVGPPLYSGGWACSASYQRPLNKLQKRQICAPRDAAVDGTSDYLTPVNLKKCLTKTEDRQIIRPVYVHGHVQT